VTEESYWLRFNRLRLSRRRLLASSAAAGLGSVTLSLLACGGDESRSPTGVSPLLNTPRDTTVQAKAGGTFKSYVLSDVQSFDPLSSSSFATHTQVAAFTYPRLFKFQAVINPQRAKGEVEGDLVESSEMSQDRLQVTLRLRQGLNWEQRAPTSGRAIDAGDVTFSWNKFGRASPSRGDLIYNGETSPGSPVESVSSPDPRTVVFRLKQADSSFLGLLASDRIFYVMPRESEGGFDPRTELRGYGPWLMSENRPGFLRAWTKNPNYYVKGRPFAETLEQAVVPDYMNRLAQFRAGLIWTSVASQDDILNTKRELPDLLLQQMTSFGAAPGSLAFGYDGETPWRDERMRQAVSLLIDRETMIDLKTDRARFDAEGLPIEVRYHSAIAASWEGFWVDPRDATRFGADARFFAYDPDEARRLMSAAGFPDGVETLLHFNGGNEYAAAYTRTAELISGMLHEGGIRARLDPREFQNDWMPNYSLGYTGAANIGRQIKGFPGIIYRTMPSYPTFATQAFVSLHRNGSRFIGMTPDGKNASGGDPDVNRMVEQLRREFDVKKQQEQAIELARFVARKAYDIPMLPYATLGFSLSWPVIGNLGVYRGWPGGSAVTETNLHYWIDDTKPPLRST
jgi:ABC-type transport system substrate-binding protein